MNNITVILNSYNNKFNDLLFNTNRDREDFYFLIKLKSLTNDYIITPEVIYKINQ